MNRWGTGRNLDFFQGQCFHIVVVHPRSRQNHDDQDENEMLEGAFAAARTAAVGIADVARDWNDMTLLNQGFDASVRVPVAGVLRPEKRTIVRRMIFARP
mmetsp:Transcript_28044/g.39422  ORF Transcript_28044/g.39422 Transcript_28044/m.39422 type:complete len:100 (-) Transcript_28044:180-479(-)